MQPSNANYQLGQAVDLGYAVIPDPGTGNVIDLKGMHLAIGRGWGAGTYKLPNLGTPGIGRAFLAVPDATQTFTTVGGTTISTIVDGQPTLFICTGASSWSSSTSLLDAGSFTTATTFEAALAEIYQHLLSTEGGWSTGIPLGSFREVTSGGDPGNAAAIGGVLASDTTPIFLGDAVEALGIQWASSNSDIIAATAEIPYDNDGAASLWCDITVISAGTTNAPSFSVLTNFDGGAQVTDTATGSAVATMQTITAEIAASDVPAAAHVVSVQLVPGAHTTDAWTVYGVRFRGKRTLLTS